MAVVISRRHRSFTRAFEAKMSTRLFERLQMCARRFPDRVAHRTAFPGATETTAFTCPELLTLSWVIEAHLCGCLPDDGLPVLVVGHKEPGMLTGLVGAVGRGHPHVPVEDRLPAHRNSSPVP